MELRAIRGGDIHDVVEFHRPANGEYPEDTEYYLKSEVDKVIAEKDKEIAEQKRLRDMALASVPNVLKVMKIIQHQKYKRCLAMAGWCEERCARYDLLQEHSGFSWRREIDFYFRWHCRWLDLAEQFNPNSTATKENNNG